MLFDLTWQCSRNNLYRSFHKDRTDSLDSWCRILRRLRWRQGCNSSTSSPHLGGRQTRSRNCIAYYTIRLIDICWCFLCWMKRCFRQSSIRWSGQLLMKSRREERQLLDALCFGKKPSLCQQTTPPSRVCCVWFFFSFLFFIFIIINHSAVP